METSKLGQGFEEQHIIWPVVNPPYSNKELTDERAKTGKNFI